MATVEERFNEVIREDDEMHELSKDKKSYVIIRNDGSVERYEEKEEFVKDASADEVWSKVERYGELVGYEQAYKDVCLALSTDVLEDIIDWLYRIHDLNEDEEIEEEEEYEFEE